MVEKDFVDSLLNTIKRRFPGSVSVRPSDNYTLGMPDILAWVPVMGPYPWSLAIEAKKIRPLLKDPHDPGRRTAPLLKHPFTGPQISMLRKLKRAQASAFGLVMATSDTAFKIDPDDLPAKTGNFTHEELVKIGSLVRRENGLWLFWGEPDHDQVLSAGHRDHPGN